MSASTFCWVLQHLITPGAGRPTAGFMNRSLSNGQRTANPGSGAWKENLQTAVPFTLCSSRIQRNFYSWTLNNQVNYFLQIDKTRCPEPCCSHRVLIAFAIKTSESLRRALHLFRRMLLNSYTQHIPLLEYVPLP